MTHHYLEHRRCSYTLYTLEELVLKTISTVT